MVSRVCWIYSEQELTPRAAEVISRIKAENGYRDVVFKPVDDSTPNGTKVLVFGRVPDKVEFIGREFDYVKTYSIAQIMSKPNAVTVLTTSLQLYFNGVHEPPKEVFPIYTAGASWLETLDFNAPTAIDIETSGNLGKEHTPEEVQLLSIAFYQEGSRPLVIVPHREDDTDKWSHSFQVWELHELAAVLTKFTKAIYHNGKFDTRVLNRLLGVKLCVWFDTMIAHHALNHAAGEHGLKQVAMRYLGAPDWDATAKSYTKGGGYYERIPRQKLVEYNGWDVYWTYQLWKLFAPQIEADSDTEMAFMFEMQVADMLLDVEAYGIPFNDTAALDLEAVESARQAEHLAWLRAYVRAPEFNPNSPQQVKAFLASQGYSVSSTDEATLTELMENVVDEQTRLFCEHLLAFRKAGKVISTYVKGWRTHARNGRVHPTFNVHGTSTGRLSSRAPNAQNMPRDKKIRAIVGLRGEE